MKMTLAVWVCMILLSSNVWPIENAQIADQGLTHVGENGGQCKVFLQEVLGELGLTIGTGYRDAYLAIGYPVSKSQVKKGDLGQSAYNTDPSREEFVHTFIVVDKLNDGRIRAVHSNWDPPFGGLVSQNEEDFEKWLLLKMPNSEGWAIRYYRVGDPVYPGEKVDGSYDQAFVNAYNSYTTNDHFRLECPMENGGSPLVHQWCSSNQPGYCLDVQDFERGILVKSPSGSVHPIIGGFYNVWIGAGDPAKYGYPLEPEGYNSSWAEQRFHKVWMQWDGQAKKIYVYNYSNQLLETYGDNGFRITILPGNGVDLELLVNPHSDTELSVSISQIANAIRYKLYLNGIYLSDVVGSEQIITGLVANTTYIVRVDAVDANNNVLATAQKTQTTQQTIPSPVLVPTLAFEYWHRDSNVLEIGIPAYTGAVRADVVISGNIYTTTPNQFYFTPSLTSSTHTLQIKLYSNAGVLVAQTNQVEVVVGLLASSTSFGPVEVGGNDSGVISFRFVCREAATINTNLGIFSGTSPWIVPAITTFPAFSVNANEIKEVLVPFITNGYSTNSQEALVLYGEGRTVTGQFVRFHKVHYISTAPFNDANVWIVDPDPQVRTGGQSQQITIGVESLSNSVQPPVRLEIVVDGQVVTSIMVPELRARGIYQEALPIGDLAAGDHLVTVVVDPDDQLVEPYDDNNSASIIMQVNAPLRPDLSVNLSLNAEYRVGDIAYGTGVVYNHGNVDSGRVEYRITDGLTVIENYIDNIPAGEVRSFNFELTISQEGSVVVLAEVDFNNLVVENNEADNDSIATLTVLPRLKPDLVAYDISWIPADNPMQTGRSYEITGWFRNTGLVAAGPFTATLKLGGETNAMQFNLLGLAAGQTASVSRTFTPSIAQNLGLILVVDSAGSVAEDREDDNYHQEVVSVVSPVLAADLIVNSTNYSAVTKKGSPTVSYAVIVRNSGTGNAGTFKVRVEIPQLGKSFTQTVYGLSVGTSITQSFSFKTNYRGQLTFKTTVDSAQQVTELNEINNYLEEQKTL